MNLPDIKGFIETSFTDWPGRIASVIFLPGCNFRCPYCHNHRLVLEPETLGSWDLSLIIDRMEQLRGWVDGVCITGGEPTIHGNLEKLLEKFKKLGWKIKLDTNGSKPRVLRGLLSANLVDAFSVDVKAPFESIPYRINAGPKADPMAVKESIELLAGSGKPIEIRTTIHPKLLCREALIRLARSSAAVLAQSGAERNNIKFTPQRCRVEETLDPALKEQAPLDPSVFDQWAAEASEAFDAAFSAELPNK